MPDWTPEQLSAIEETTGDLLVSASAGTGKTAVLVERIVRLLLDSDDPVDIDRFLVVTFTEAAAAEMRGKIGDALRARLAERPGDGRLRRQLLLLDNAQISTIHAFCLTLIRRHFHRLGLDPEFTLLDEQEGPLLRSEVIAQVFEAVFREDKNLRFARWLDTFVGVDPTLSAQERVLHLHGFLRSLPDPEGWVAKVRGDYPLDDVGAGVCLPLEAHFWFREWARLFRGELGELVRALEVERPVAAADEPRYGAWIDSLRGALDEALSAADRGDWAGAVDAVRVIELGRFPGWKNRTPAGEALGGRLQGVARRLKKYLQEELAPGPVGAMSAAHAASAPSVHLTLDMVERFGAAYAEAKNRRAVLDFEDLEHLALRLLREGGADGALRPSEIAGLCHDQYAHVLVDEYQDTSPIQDAILSLVSRRHAEGLPGNLFAVGDVKQSIYAFRLAAPEIFLDKYARFPAVDEVDGDFGRNADADATGRRVDLRTNFRSRAAVLDGANALFERVMTRGAGGLDYDERAALRAGAAYPEGESKDLSCVEVLLLDAGAEAGKGEDTGEDADGPPEEESAKPTLEEWTAMEREAAWIGRRIREMVNGPTPLRVLNRQGGAGGTPTRAVEFRDVVILLRSMRTRAETYARVLSAQGIPVFAEMSRGYFGAQEVRDVVNLLRVIDNPRQDVPLAAVLRSPLVGWSDSDLLAARRLAPKTPFHAAVLDGEIDAEAGGVAAKVGAFRGDLERWRTLARRGPLADLVTRLYEETAYPLHVLGLAGAETRRANLDRLRDLAARFDHFSRQGLGRFVRFIDRLRDEESDFGGASPMAEGENAVRLMTIHKSKGLEFPVVFVADLGKQMQLGSREGAVYARDLGMALPVTDLGRGVSYKTPGLRVLARARRHRDVAEEMRILYVALTRAREKLVLSGSVKNLEKRREDWAGAVWSHSGGGREVLANVSALGARTCLDWLMPVLMRAGGGAEGQAADVWVGTADGRGGRFRLTPLAGMPMEAAVDAVGTAEPAGADATGRDDVSALAARVMWRYPHAVLGRTAARVSATELKRRREMGVEEGERARRLWRREDAFAYPAAQERPGTAGMERGSLTHLVLQHLNLLRHPNYAEISRQVDGMIDAGMLTEAQREAVDFESIVWFFASEVGARVLAAPPDRVWREVPFLLGLPPSQAGAPELAAYDEEERVRAQGVIDCLVEEAGGLLLIDYKTDAVPPEGVEARARAYAPQMWLYSRAVSGIFSKPLHEAWLVFLGPRRICPAPVGGLT